MQMIEVEIKEQEKIMGTRNFDGITEGSLLFINQHSHRRTQSRGMQGSFILIEADWKRQTFICTGRGENAVQS